NNLQIKSNDLSTNMFHPQTTHMYKKMKHNIFQGALVRKMVESFSRPQDITLHIESLISNLQYNPEISSKDFENSLAKVGEFLGFNVQMPEKEMGNGPDVLWCMSDGIYLVLEAKSMAVHDEITRENIGQLLISE